LADTQQISAPGGSAIPTHTHTHTHGSGATASPRIAKTFSVV